ncbi:hypothetical protein CHUAL_010392 [Chamberlinius hualienensis]
MVLTLRIPRLSFRLYSSTQPWSEGRLKGEQLVFPFACFLAATGLSISTFSLKQLGSIDSRSPPPQP